MITTIQKTCFTLSLLCFQLNKKPVIQLRTTGHIIYEIIQLLVIPKVMFEVEDFLFNLFRFQQQIHTILLQRRKIWKPEILNVALFDNETGEPAHLKDVVPAKRACIIQRIKCQWTGESFYAIGIIQPE